jgi:hypothetical protein
LLNRDEHHADDGGGEPNDLVPGHWLAARILANVCHGITPQAIG